MGVVTRCVCDICGKEVEERPESWTGVEVVLDPMNNDEDYVDILICDGACARTPVAQLRRRAEALRKETLEG